MPSPEHQMVVELLRAQGRAISAERTVAEMRAQIDLLAETFAVPDDVTVSPADVAGVPCEWIEAPGADLTAAILFLHGGAYTHGSLASHRTLSARIARAAGTRVLAADYRLAPEHPHPAGLDDALAVYRAMLASGLDAKRVVIGGDSAGGGLTMATLLALRDADEPLPAGGVLLSPWLDLTLSGDSMMSAAEADVVLAPSGLADAAEMYAGELDPKLPALSPLFGSLEGLPPLRIFAGTADVLVDDARRFAPLAEAAGADVELTVEPELIHDWFIMAGVPEAEATVAATGTWVATRLAG